MIPLVSIVLPFRNAAATLHAAVGSIRAQTFRDWELLSVDDGSGDNSMDVVIAAMEGDPRLKCLRNEHAPGVCGATQTGSDHARGEWLARMDADDVCDPQRFEKQLAMADLHPEWQVIGGCVEIPNPLGDGMVRYVEWTNSLVTPEQIAAARFIENPIVNPTMMMRRDLFEKSGGYRQTEWAEDHDLWLRLLDAGVVMGKVPEILLQWRDSPTRLTRSDIVYGDRARQRMRAHFLARLPSVRERGVVVAGAGPIGKELARLLQAEGIAVRGFFEVSPKRIGEIIHGVEVADSAKLGELWRDAVLLSSVGVAGAREVVRSMALGAGYIEGVDFWCTC